MMKFNGFGRSSLSGIIGLLAVAAPAVSCSSDGTGKGTENVDNGAKSNWTMQGYDPQSTFHNTAEKKISVSNAKDLAVDWEIVLSAAGTPAVSDGVVYVPENSTFSALKLSTGELIWKLEQTDVWLGTTGSPAYAEGHVYFLAGTGGIVYSLNATDGSIEWQTRIEENQYASGYSSIVINGDTLVVGNSSSEELYKKENATFKGGVVALNRKTGDLLWKSNTAGDGENGCSVWGSVSIDKAGTVFAGTGNNYTETAGPGSDSVFAFALDGGAEKWRKQVTQNDVFTIVNPRSPDTDFGANVITIDPGGRKFVIGGQKSGDIYAFDRETGEQAWTRKLGDGSANIGGVFQGLSYDGTNIIVANNHATSDAPGGEALNGDSGSTSVLFALDPLTGDIVWQRQLGAWVWNPITIANGVGFVGIERKMQAFDVATGEVLNEWPVNGTITGGAAISDGHVCFQSGVTYFGGHPDNKFRCLALPGDIGKGGTGGTGGATATDPNAPTFSNVYKEVIVASGCGTSVCHGAGKGGNLVMDGKTSAYTNLVGVDAAGDCPGGTATCGCGTSGKKRVVANDPDASLLVEKLSGSPSCGDRMPPTGDPIDDTLLTLVKNWIAAGAPND